MQKDYLSTKWTASGRLLLAFALLFSSCQVSGLTSDYRKLSRSEISRIQPYNGQAVAGMAHPVTAPDILSLLRRQAQSLVYIWTPSCNGAACLPLSYFARYADERKLALIVIADGYKDIFADQTYPYKFVIDPKAYGSNLRISYRRRFVAALTGSRDKITGDHNYFIFSQDSLLTSGFTNELK